MDTRAVSFTLATVLVATSAAGAATTKHHHIDENELYSLRMMYPVAVTALERGEELLRAGDLQGARERFADAARQVPSSALFARRHCQVLSLLGRRTEAVSECQRTMEFGGTPLDHRALVGAMLAGDAPADPQDLGDAYLLATGAKRKLPHEPWGDAALCDIIAHVGDAATLEQCVANLVEIDPDHYETRRAASMLRARAGSSWVFGWAALALAFGGTLAHAVWRGRRRWLRSAGPAALALGALAHPGTAHADEPAPAASASAAPAEREGGSQGLLHGLSRWPIDDADPMKTLPTTAQRDADPLEFGYHLMDLTNRAQAAANEKDYAKAIRYLRAAAKAVPDRAITFSRICEYEEILNEPQKALEACGTALTLPGVLAGDYVRYGKLLLSKEGTFTEDDSRDLKEVMDHLRAQGPDAAKLAEQMQCPFALRTLEEKRLESCVKEFVKRNPNSQEAVMYQWALALKRENLSEAKSLVGRAKTLQLPPEGVAQMERAVSEAESARLRRWFLDWKVGAVLLAGIGAFAAWFTLKRLRSAPRPRLGTPT